MKDCSKCGARKERSEFSRDRCKQDGLCTVCKECRRAYRKKYYADHAEEAKRASSQWVKENRAWATKRNNLWVARNRDKWLKYRSGRHKQRYQKDSSYRINCLVRSMVQRVLRASDKPKDFVTFERLGYTNSQLRARLEMNFSEGMGWHNHGEWEIDHRVPVSALIRRGERRAEAINCLANLYPRWKHENRSKGARYSS